MSTNSSDHSLLLIEYRTKFDKTLELLTKVPYTRERLALYSRKIVEILLVPVIENDRVKLDYVKNPIFEKVWVTSQKYKNHKKLQLLVAQFLQEIAIIVIKVTNPNLELEHNNVVFKLIVKDLGTWVNFWFIFVLHIFHQVQKTANKLGNNHITLIPMDSFLKELEIDLSEENIPRYKFLTATYDFLLDKFGWEGIERKNKEDFDASASSEVLTLAMSHPDDEDLEYYRDTREIMRSTIDIPRNLAEIEEFKTEFQMPSDEIWALEKELKGFFSDSDL